MTDELELKKIVGEVAAAYFSNSHVTPTEIPTVINHIANSLAAIGVVAAEAEPQAPQPSLPTQAQIRRSITRDGIISFEDNRAYKTMRRHLASRGMTPDEYRTKWGLPRDYPMVAPAYSEARSSLAKELGLGGRPRAISAPAAQVSAAPPEPTASPATPRRGGGRTAVRAAAAKAAPAPSVQAAEIFSDHKGDAKRSRSAASRPRQAR